MNKAKGILFFIACIAAIVGLLPDVALASGYVISVTAQPTAIAVNGAASITAVVTNIGVPVECVTVDFTVTSGPGQATASATTDSAGCAYASYTSSSAGTATIQAQETVCNQSNTCTVDVGFGPTLSIGAPSASSYTGDPVSYTLTYSGADGITLDTSNVHLNATGTASGTLAVSGSGNAARTVTVSNVVGNGTLGISVDSGTAFNAFGGAPAAGPSATFQIDGPVCTITGPSSLTNLNPIPFTITFSEPVDDLTGASLSVGGTAGATGATITSSCLDSTYYVNVSGMTSSGTVVLTIPQDAVYDAFGAGNPIASSSVDFNQVIMYVANSGGNDQDTGLSWSHAMKTINAALTASALESGGKVWSPKAPITRA